MNEVPAEKESTFENEASQHAAAIFDELLRHTGERITPSLAGELAFKLAGIDSEYIPGAIPQRLVGITEIAALRGISKQRIFQHAQKENFPEPIARLAMGPIWDEAKVIEFFGINNSSDTNTK